MTQNKSLNIGIVCGEYSGDTLGAGIIQEIKKYSNVNLFGVGGPKLEELGVKSKFDFSELQGDQLKNLSVNKIFKMMIINQYCKLDPHILTSSITHNTYM